MVPFFHLRYRKFGDAVSTSDDRFVTYWIPVISVLSVTFLAWAAVTIACWATSDDTTLVSVLKMQAQGLWKLLHRIW